MKKTTIEALLHFATILLSTPDGGISIVRENEQSDDDRKALDALAKVLHMKKPFDRFSKVGLRFNHEYLNTIGKTLIVFPIETMAMYADIVTVNAIDGKMPPHQSPLSIPDQWLSISEQGLVDSAVMDINNSELYDGVNVTGIGNSAYAVLHSRNERLVKRSMDFLLMIKRRYADEFFNSVFQSNNKA